MNINDGLNIVAWLNSDASVRLILTLGHSLWQGLLIAGFATAINAMLKRSAANTRYAVWLVAFALLVTSPLVTYSLLSTSPSQDVGAVTQLPQPPTPVALVPAPLPTESAPPQFNNESPNPSPENVSKIDSKELTSAASLSSIWQQFVPYLVGVYAAVVLLLLVRLIVALYAGRHLRVSAKPITDSVIVRTISQTSQELGIRVKPIVLTCRRVLVPTVVGVLQPVVLLPAAFVTALPIDQLKSIIAHEIAHIRRWDHLVNVIQRIVEALLFFNPAVWWISNRLRVVREHCCDDIVVAMGVKRTDYATMLLDVAELSQASEPHLQAALQLSGQKSNLGDRVRRLLGASTDDVRLNRSGILAVVALLFALIMGVTQWSDNVTAEENTNDKESDNKKSSSNEADLGRGITIELLGITTHPANPNNWWNGSGKPFETAPCQGFRGAKVRTDQGLSREVAFRVHGLPENYITEIDIDGSGSMATSSSENSGVTGCAFTLPKAEPATTIRFSATPDVWDLAAAINMRGEVVTIGDNKLMKASKFEVGQDENLVKLAFDHSRDRFQDGSMSVVAIDRDGTEHSNNGMSAGGDRDGYQRSEFDFKIAATKVAKFEIRFRVFRHIAIFEDVSMHPNKKTNQTVRTEHVESKKAEPRPSVQSINVKDSSGWGEPKNGLQARLTQVHEYWQHWQQPRLELEVRNLTDKDLPLRHLTIELGPNREQQKLLGLRRRYGRFEVLIDDVPSQVAAQERIANFRLAKSLKELNVHVPVVPAGKQIRMPVVLTAARNTNRDDPKLQSGRYAVSLNHMDTTGRASFVAAAAPLEILPPGINSHKDFAKKLREYPIYDWKILAGFVPTNPTVVWGAPIEFNFVVCNRNKNVFGYGFGGDYRGLGRHDRFKIEIRTESGQLLKDPKAGPNGVLDFGGMVWANKVAPGDIQSTSIKVSDFRTIPGPGKYFVKCEFDLRNDFDATQEFEQIVGSEFELIVLPRDERSSVEALEQFFKTANATGGAPLKLTIDTICAFGGKHAIDGLVRMTLKGDRTHRLEATRGLGLIRLAQSRDALIKLASDDDSAVQLQAIRSLGNYTDNAATDTVIAALNSKSLDVQLAAAETLGAIGTEKAIQKLIEKLPENTGPLAIAILKGMGLTESNQLVAKIADSLTSADSSIRRAAVDALVSIGGSEAVDALDKHKLSEDFEFREYVIRHLVEKLAQPMEPEWLVPVLQSRKDTNSNGHAPTLMRLYCKDRAVPAILSAMDFENPKVRHRFNRTLVWDQLSCRGALAIPWNGDLNRDGTPEEIAQNKETLRILKLWVERDAQQPIEAPILDWTGPDKIVWGTAVDGLAIRIRPNRVVWPEGLPQVVTIDGELKNGSSASFQKQPAILEVEVDGQWYDFDREIGLKVVGEWDAYHSRQFHDLQLDSRWLRKSDQKPLVLKPGKHRVRVRVSTLKENERHGLATSPSVEIEVMKTSL